MSLNKFDFWAQTTLIGTAIVGFCIILALDYLNFSFYPVINFFAFMLSICIGITPAYQVITGLVKCRSKYRYDYFEDDFVDNYEYYKTQTRLYGLYLLGVILYVVSLIFRSHSYIQPSLLFVFNYCLAIKNYWEEGRQDNYNLKP